MSEETIHVNGREETLGAETLARLLVEKEIAPETPGIAVAVNGSVVPKARWSETPLKAGDRVEIVRALQGG